MPDANAVSAIACAINERLGVQDGEDCALVALEALEAAGYVVSKGGGGQ